MEGIEFSLELKDEMSSSARQAAEALRSLKEEAVHAGESISKLSESISKLSEHHKSLRHESKEAKGFLKEFTKSMIPDIALGELAAEGIKKLAEGVFELGERLFDAGVELVKFSLETSEFKESTEDAFSAVLGSANKGKELYEEVSNISSVMHIPVEKAQGMAQHLLQLGLDNEDQIKGTIAAVSRLERAGLGGGAEKLQTVIERSLASGEFKIKGKQLSGTGVTLPDLYEDLSKRLNKSVPEVKALMQAGKVDVQVGIASMTDLINGSKIAEIADKKFTLKDVATDWHNNWVRLTEELSAGPLVAAFRDLVGVFSQGQESGKGLKDVIVESVDGIIKWVAKAIEAVGIFIIKFETGFYLAEAAMMPAIKQIEKFVGGTDSLIDLSEAAKSVGKYITEAAIGVIWFGAALFRGTSMIKDAATEWSHAGEQLVMGLIEGIKHGATAVADAAKSLAHGAVNAVKETLGIHSPSKVMIEMGKNTTEGFEQGVEAGGGARTVMREQFSAPSIQPKSVQSKGHSFDFSGLTVQIYGVQRAEEILTLLPSALTDALEQAANEMGA